MLRMNRNDQEDDKLTGAVSWAISSNGNHGEALGHMSHPGLIL